MSDSTTSAASGNPPKLTFFKALTKSRKSVFSRLSNLFTGSTSFGQREIDELHDALILSDVGYDVSEAIINRVKTSHKRSNSSGEDIFNVLYEELLSILSVAEQDFSLTLHPSPTVILMVGVNGVGKTTTCAKIANFYKNQGQSVMLAACDTFRAAAIEQIQTWGKRLDIPVIAQSAGADPAAVAHDAMHAAIARESSVLLVDTAGRQQTRDDLMRQLNKIQRVISRIEPSAPHETLITIDAGTGQNGIVQVEKFNEHTPISGICVCKLDGTAKGGIVVALARQFSLPIAFVGLGEKVEDLSPFQAGDYVASLIGMKQEAPVDGQ